MEDNWVPVAYSSDECQSDSSRQDSGSLMPWLDIHTHTWPGPLDHERSLSRNTYRSFVQCSFSTLKWLPMLCLCTTSRSSCQKSLSLYKPEGRKRFTSFFLFALFCCFLWLLQTEPRTLGMVVITLPSNFVSSSLLPLISWICLPIVYVCICLFSNLK